LQLRVNLRAFSSEVDTGSREENASKQEREPPFRFNRNGKGSSDPLLKAKADAVSVICPVKPTFGGENDAISARICDSHFDRDGAFGDFGFVWFTGARSHMRQRRAKMSRSSED
jgi:hypothetical protein